MRILLIDDNAYSTDMLSMLLETQGHHVLVAFSGIAGLALAHAADPELVIVDLGLPDMDGIEVIRILHATSRGKKPTIAAFTGRTDRASHALAVEAGASSYFIKGDDISKLLALTEQPLEF